MDAAPRANKTQEIQSTDLKIRGTVRGTAVPTSRDTEAVRLLRSDEEKIVATNIKERTSSHCDTYIELYASLSYELETKQKHSEIITKHPRHSHSAEHQAKTSTKMDIGESRSSHPAFSAPFSASVLYGRSTTSNTSSTLASSQATSSSVLDLYSKYGNGGVHMEDVLRWLIGEGFMQRGEKITQVIRPVMWQSELEVGELIQGYHSGC